MPKWCSYRIKRGDPTCSDLRKCFEVIQYRVTGTRVDTLLQNEVDPRELPGIVENLTWGNLSLELVPWLELRK
jgi:hypothetical protein